MSSVPADAPPPGPSFGQAFLYWLKLGFVSFGGPAGQIAIMHEELVERRRWISENRFLHALSYCMVLPGPEAQQLATYIGWLMHRTWGGIVAGGLFVLPSLFILVGLSWVYMVFGNVPVVAGIEHHQWLSATQMIDGLALGETTPGLLIMVVSFVGFVGGWTKAIFCSEALFLSGAAAAAVVTLFTFLPSFLFILLGAPFIESTHGKLEFTAPLTAITAAVVGVIVNLAVFFAYHVSWPRGLHGPFEWPSALVGLAAGIALFRFKAGVILVVLSCGAAGLLVSLGRSLP